MASKRVTLAQVAAAAGVAVSTASLVLSGKGDSVRISQVVQQRVKDQAAQMGYRPNAVSVGLRKGTTSTLGFVSDSVASSRLAGEMIKGAIEAARDLGLMVFVAETSGNAHQEELLTEAMLDRQVDGIIFAAMFTQERDVPKQLSTTPHVLLNIAPRGEHNAPVVLPDEYQAGRDAIAQLLAAGHSEIHLIGAGPRREDFPPRSLGAQRRLQGIMDALDDAGITPASGVQLHQWLPPDGWRATGDLLAAGASGAIVCFNDRLAMGAYQAIHEAGKSVPGDISIISFDDASIAAWLRPGLTTFALPHRAMGKKAAELLAGLVADTSGNVTPSTESLIPMPLRLRESIASAVAG